MKRNELEVSCLVCPNCKRDVTAPFGDGRECVLCSWKGDAEEMLPTVPVSDLRSRLHDIEEKYVDGFGEEDENGYVPESKLDRYEEAWKKLRQELAEIGSEDAVEDRPDGVALTQEESETVRWMADHIHLRERNLSREKREQVWRLMDKLDEEQEFGQLSETE